MKADIILPDLGASPAVLSIWFAEPGEAIFEGERLVEILVGAATFDVAAPATGTLVEQSTLPADVLAPGQVLGVVEVADTEG
jgi:pyruvate/2-oxoglutarate dehydrogenase complex dihydrolipoamide acyltransferase (E2) component